MVAAIGVLWTVALVSQSAPTPAAPPRAAGLIVGRVVDGSTNSPIAGAIVSILSGFGPGSPPRAMTSAGGYFVFRKLPRGSYSLAATRPGYVDGAYGRRRPGGTAASLQLQDGERVSGVVIAMWRQAAIGGTISDEAGEPVIGAQVTAYQRRFAGGRDRILPAGTATTDDRGAYRIAALSPGEYLVAFIWKETSVPAATAELLRTAPSTNDPKAQDALRERFTLGASLAVPGSSTAMQVGSSVRDLPSDMPVPPPSSDSVYIYPSQFYPGVPSPARSTAIVLASGQERPGVDFTLTPVKTVRVSGTLLGPDGPVATAAIRLVATGDDSFPQLETSATLTGDGGEFTLLGVPPGQYTLKVLRTPRPAAPAAGTTTTMTQIQVGSSMVMTTTGPLPGGTLPPPTPVSDEPTLFSDTPVNVGTRDVADALVTLQRGPRIAGRFEFDGAHDRPDARALMRIPITLDRVDVTPASNARVAVLPGHADETGAFKTPAVAAGRYVVRVGGILPDWTLKSVTVDGRDVSDSPLDLRASDVNTVIITFTDRPTKLNGVARTAEGSADADAVVVVFPVDQSAWSDYGYNPRRVRSTHAGRDGSYTIAGLPAGDYYVAAIHEDTTPQWQEPRALEALARAATQVRLGDGDTRTQDLKAVRGGPQ